MVSTLKVNAIKRQSGTTITVAESGDTINVVSGATLDINSGATIDATGATITGFGGASDEQVKVSSDDTTAGFLNGKLTAGTSITLTEGSGGGDETLAIAYSTPATLPAASGVNLTALNATQLTSGKVPTAQLGTGTASSSTILYGDQTYKTEPSSGTSWQSVETGSTMTAVAGNGYPINTTSNACTVTLPAGSVGDTVELVDYAGTWDTNNVTIAADGAEKIQGSTSNVTASAEREGIRLVYVDGTQGWLIATAANEGTSAVSTAISFLCIAGGGSGGSESNSGGGGAGGYRTSTQTVGSGVEITITVGDGGAASSGTTYGNVGVASSFSGSGLTTISSAGGGRGGTNSDNAGDGGSGGGGGPTRSGGASAPVTAPVQGYAGGTGSGSAAAYGGGGGGGASEVGENGSGSKGGDGGDGIASSISGSSITRGGGGGGGTNTTIGSGGSGGGGDGGPAGGGNGTAGTINKGGGGGACESGDSSGAGGKGVVILSMPDSEYSGSTTGSPTVTTDAGGTGNTTLIFTGSGTYTTQELLWLVLQKQD